jgi:prevent-host-death family protein
MERIGVRELRQHASRYLARVRTGETIEVTDRGQPIARLVPIAADVWAGRVAAGAVRPPTDPAPLAQVVPQQAATPLSDVLRRMREEDSR